jgi:hypothetical protein
LAPGSRSCRVAPPLGRRGLVPLSCPIVSLASMSGGGSPCIVVTPTLCRGGRAPRRGTRGTFRSPRSRLGRSGPGPPLRGPLHCGHPCERQVRQGRAMRLARVTAGQPNTWRGHSGRMGPGIGADTLWQVSGLQWVQVTGRPLIMSRRGSAPSGQMAFSLWSCAASAPPGSPTLLARPPAPLPPSLSVWGVPLLFGPIAIRDS